MHCNWIYEKKNLKFSTSVQSIDWFLFYSLGIELSSSDWCACMCVRCGSTSKCTAIFVVLCFRVFVPLYQIHKHIAKQVNKNLLHHNKRTHSHHSFVHDLYFILYVSFFSFISRVCPFVPMLLSISTFSFSRNLPHSQTYTYTHERSQHAYVFDNTNNDHTFSKSQNVYASFKSLSRT